VPAVSTHRSRRPFIAVALAGALLSAPTAAAPPADNGAVVVMYHRFGEPDHPSTNIRLEQFEAHIAELASGSYTVLPVPEIVAALRAGRELPARTVGITVDDAYLSLYAEAWPRLRAAGLPFTIFVTTGPLDQVLPGYMSWNQLREMTAEGRVTVGHHNATHGHMARQDAATNRAQIAEATARFRAELGTAPALFAYPYGEYSLELRDIVHEAGLEAAFGQHSGPISRTHDLFALPRYPLNETYGDMDRFRLVVNSLPLPTAEVTPADPLIRAADNPPAYGFTVLQGVSGLSALDCFASDNETAVERLGERRIEVRLARPFGPGRRRINCTMPGPDGRWRWFGRQFYVLP
jgi:peptidoglycan/xylan/chitin deacetylase (PgdA/CDA1 family)